MIGKVESVLRLSQAVNAPGPAPHIHRKALTQLRVEWPTLARALNDVLASHGYPTPKELR